MALAELFKEHHKYTLPVLALVEAIGNNAYTVAMLAEHLDRPKSKVLYTLTYYEHLFKSRLASPRDMYTLGINYTMSVPMMWRLSPEGKELYKSIQDTLKIKSNVKTRTSNAVSESRNK